MLSSRKLEIKALCHAFDKKQILDNINICLHEGEVMAVVGRSGCGKSTLLNIVAGLLEADSGEIINDFLSLSILFQDPRLLPWKTVKDNIAWGLKAKGVAKSEREKSALLLALEVGLKKEDLIKYPHELSGGMRQRVAVARSLAVKPDFLLLDEPFSALDVGLKEELHALLLKEIAGRSLTVLFITHDLIEAIKLADHIIVLDDDPGRVVYQYASEKHLTQSEQFVAATHLLQIDVVKQAFKAKDH